MHQTTQVNSMTPWQLNGAGETPSGLSQLDPIPLDLNPLWLQSRLGEKGQTLRYFTLAHHQQLLGYAPFLNHRGVLGFYFGETSLFSIPVNRYAMQGAPLCDSASQLQGLFGPLRKATGNKGVVFLEGIPMDSLMGELLSSPISVVRQFFHVVPYGPVYARRMIKLPPQAAFDDYMASLGSGTRRDIRRTRRDFQSNAGGAVRMTCYTEPAQSDELALALAQVSRKTYQYHLLGLGLENTAAHTRQLRLAADGGWLRAYVLWVDDLPVAFQLGYHDSQTYYGHHVGYDPAMSKLQPGIYLHTELMADLLKSGISNFDFLSGDSLYKQRLSNTLQEERHYYLIPRGWPGTLYAGMLVTVNSLSEAIGRQLDKSDLKGRIKRWVRNASVKRSGQRSLGDAERSS